MRHTENPKHWDGAVRFPNYACDSLGLNRNKKWFLFDSLKHGNEHVLQCAAQQYRTCGITEHHGFLRPISGEADIDWLKEGGTSVRWIYVERDGAITKDDIDELIIDQRLQFYVEKRKRVKRFIEELSARYPEVVQRAREKRAQAQTMLAAIRARSAPEHEEPARRIVSDDGVGGRPLKRARNSTKAEITAETELAGAPNASGAGDDKIEESLALATELETFTTENDGEGKELDVGGDLQIPAPATAQEISEDESGDDDDDGKMLDGDGDTAMLAPDMNFGELASGVETSGVSAVGSDDAAGGDGDATMVTPEPRHDEVASAVTISMVSDALPAIAAVAPSVVMGTESSRSRGVRKKKTSRSFRKSRRKRAFERDNKH